MATFYVLPPRELLEHHMNGWFARMLPQFPFPANWFELCCPTGPDTIILHREDLPESDDLVPCLCEIYGAEPGDLVVEYGPISTQGAATQTWQIPLHASNIPSAR